VTVAEAAASVLLWLGVATEVVCLVGVMWMRDALDQLHYAAAATAVGPVLIAVAAGLTGFSSVSGTIGCVVACALLFVLNPVLTSATGRAGRHLRGLDEPTADEWDRQP
jgi:monovalent cation/proton antiporter MnhG/PhaG subunit